jgi:hypothetical protein
MASWTDLALAAPELAATNRTLELSAGASGLQG